eukprot:m.189183 g.189183  ORF g.189183 m.189183 type:complete len:99 (+) comp39405_c0_seq13:120-416(+)
MEGNGDRGNSEDGGGDGVAADANDEDCGGDGAAAASARGSSGKRRRLAHTQFEDVLVIAQELELFQSRLKGDGLWEQWDEVRTHTKRKWRCYGEGSPN